MKFSSLAVLAVASVAVAEPAAAEEYSSPLLYVDSTTTAATPSATVAAPSFIAESTPIATSQGHSATEWDNLPSNLKQFIIDSHPKPHLEERQNAAQGGGQVAGQPTTPTQVSPVTIYDIGAGPQTYTQTFAPTPDQFPSPSAGSIGMGTIQGQVGTTRSVKNPAATAHVDSRVILAVAGGIGAGIII